MKTSIKLLVLVFLTINILSVFGQYTYDVPPTDASSEDSQTPPTEASTETQSSCFACHSDTGSSEETSAYSTEYTTETPTTYYTTRYSTEAPSTETPSTEYSTETPSTEYSTETPSTEYSTETPSTEYSTETPSTEYSTETPTTYYTTEYSTEAPSTEYSTETPSTEYSTETPSTEYSTETPSTEYSTETPSTEYSTETPSTGYSTETPTTYYTTEYSTEYSTETPSTEYSTETPSTEYSTETPSTEYSTEETLTYNTTEYSTEESNPPTEASTESQSNCNPCLTNTGTTEETTYYSTSGPEQPPYSCQPPCNNESCCACLQIPNPTTGVGYLEYQQTCLDGGLHCVDNSGCMLCYRPVEGGHNVGNRPVCDRFGGSYDPTANCTDDGCCIDVQGNNENDGNGYLEYYDGCFNNSLLTVDCIQDHVGCRLCYRPGTGGTNVGNRPICRRYQSQGNLDAVQQFENLNGDEIRGIANNAGNALGFFMLTALAIYLI